jgi:isopentenyl diphosphate isomerase/L-lactate dehydrogenase-like FMN-dependent dehydrogenase
VSIIFNWPEQQTGSFGQPGVEAVIDILRREFTLAMRQCGTPTIAQIT